MSNLEIRAGSSDTVFNATFFMLGMLAMPVNALMKMMSPEGLIPPVVSNGIYGLSALIMVAAGVGMSSAHRRTAQLQSIEEAQRPVVESADALVTNSGVETQAQGL